MSGPKISIYSLDERSRNIVLGQMQCDREGRVCVEQIKALLSSCSDMGSELNKSLGMLEFLQKKSGGQKGVIEEAKSLQKSWEKEFKSIQSEFEHNIPKFSHKYYISEKVLEEKKRERKKIAAIRDKAQELKDKLEKVSKAGKSVQRGVQRSIVEYLTDGKDDRAHVREGNGHSGLLTGADGDDDRSHVRKGKDLSAWKSDIAADLGGVFSFDDIGEGPGGTGFDGTFKGTESVGSDGAGGVGFDGTGGMGFDGTGGRDSDSTGGMSFDDRKKAVRDELAGLLKPELPQELRNAVLLAVRRLDNISQLANLTNFESITVKKIFRDVKAWRMECERKEAEFAEAVIRYQVLCDMADRADERDRRFADKDELEAAVSELEAIIVRQKEQSYIADCVDEVMADMGYDLIGRREVRKKSGRQFKNELYQFGEGTAVNITYSSEGQISMELGGIAREDRIPDEEETAALTQEMEKFCGEFSEFEKRMKAKGVIVGDRIALMPPTAEHAAIINVNDYEVEAGKQITEMNAGTKRKKTTAGRKMHKEDE